VCRGHGCDVHVQDGEGVGDGAGWHEVRVGQKEVVDPVAVA
jgi:hypothetical protein